jgi:hypothetical protein
MSPVRPALPCVRWRWHASELAHHELIEPCCCGHRHAEQAQLCKHGAEVVEASDDPTILGVLADLKEELVAAATAPTTTVELEVDTELRCELDSALEGGRAAAICAGFGEVGAGSRAAELPPTPSSAISRDEAQTGSGPRPRRLKISPRAAESSVRLNSAGASPPRARAVGETARTTHVADQLSPTRASFAPANSPTSKRELHVSPRAAQSSARLNRAGASPPRAPPTSESARVTQVAVATLNLSPSRASFAPHSTRQPKWKR